MSEKLELANRCISLAHVLKNLFEEQYEEMVKLESASQFDFSTNISNLKWIKENLPILSKNLLLIPSLLKLEIDINDCFEEEFRVRGTSKLELEWINPDSSKEIYYGSLPSAAITPYEEVWKNLKNESTSRFSFSDMYALLEKIKSCGANIQLMITLSVSKNRINEDLVANDTNYQNIICYLFPESLISNLKSISLETFENEFYKHGKRTVIPVFGLSGYLRGDFLSIIGYDYINNLLSEVNNPISDEIIQKANKSLNLRKYHSSGNFPTNYLTPDLFLILVEKNNNELKKELLNQLNSLMALLSALFLANYCETYNDEYKIEYIGRGQVSFVIKHTTLLEYEPYFNDLYQLYVYAYDSFSIDKLEIARQFLSQSVDNVASLFRRAERIKDATKAAYDSVLIKKVSDYFDARQKIEDAIKDSIEETSTGARNLSQDVSKDLYTIAGIIVIAVAGILIKPDFDLKIAVSVASIVIAAYMFLIILYHLSTIKQAHNSQIGQTNSYIKSFEEVLSPEEINKFLENKQIKDVNTLFDNTIDNAYLIYSIILTLSLMVAVIEL